MTIRNDHKQAEALLETTFVDKHKDVWAVTNTVGKGLERRETKQRLFTQRPIEN